MPRVAPISTARARELRTNATPEERLLWRHLRHHPRRFTRQLPVGRYILDFACRSVRIAVELDGSQHHQAAGYDAVRTAFLESLGWRVLRFWNSDVRDNIDGVVDVIDAAVGAANGPTHPRPLPFREGR